LAVNKRKILESAQKFLQKGALDKALKEYQTLLEVDPRDSGARLKLGDIHLRLGKKDDAVAAYLKVAHQFMKDGFDAKAVALFKQIAKLAPGLFEIQVPLAELYQRLGLTAEAMAALQTATEGFQKAGRKREALELLRKAAALDPTNTTSRLKIADLLRQQGMMSEALTEYDEVAAELERNGENETLATVHACVLEIEPDRVPALLSLARVLLQTGENARAHELADRAATLRPDLIEALELQAEALQALGRADVETEAVFRRLADLHRARGNEGRAREILQRFVPAHELTLNGVESLDSGVPAESFPGSDLLEDLTQAGAKLGPSVPARPPDLVPAQRPSTAPVATPPLDASTAAPAAPSAAPAGPAAEADVEQLLAEAGVYLRFGKRDRAIVSLEAALAQSPDHLGGLEKLADALVHDGELERAVELFARGADVARARGDETSAARFLARLLELGSGATESLEASSTSEEDPVVVAESMPAPQASTDAAPAPEEPAAEFEVELDLPDDGDLELAVEIGSATSEAPEGPPGALGSEIDFGPDAEPGDEIEFAAPEERELTLAPEVAARLDLESSVEEESRPSLELEVETESEPELEPVSDALPVAAVALEPDGEKTPPTVPSPKQILEDLEEADFYFQQSLFVEAEAVYRRILDLAPTNPQALLRLGEIAAARGDDPGAGRPALAFAPAFDDATQPRVANSSEGEAALGDDLAHWDDDVQPSEQTVDADGFQSALGDEAALDVADECPTEVAPPFTAETEPALEAAGEAVGSDASGDTREISHFDLAAELSDALSDDDTAAQSQGATAPEAEPSFEAIFSEFKLGVQKTLTAADHETHYDLGIAYREMGLLEDAMGEFEVALESPERHLDCLYMLGLCARELKRGSDAIAFFRQTLVAPDLPAERRAAISFDLGIALEECGEVAAALEIFDEVAAIDPAFPGLEERTASLRALLPLTPSPESDGPPPAAAAEVYESFDDLIADAEAAIATNAAAPRAPVDGDATLVVPREPASEPAPVDPPPKPPRGTSPRRRKTSFG
jgi:tetratricopeptide (TPR) repeat protein